MTKYEARDSFEAEKSSPKPVVFAHNARLTLPNGDYYYVPSESSVEYMYNLYDNVNMKNLSLELNIPKNTADRIADMYGLKPDIYGDYPDGSYEVVNEEIKWIKFYQDLPNDISLDDISTYMGWNKDVVQAYASGIYDMSPNKTGEYDKQLLAKLRQQIMKTPYNDEGWTRIEKLSPDMDSKAIKTILDKSPYKTVRRRVRGDGRPYWYCHPEAKSLFSKLSKRNVESNIDSRIKNRLSEDEFFRVDLKDGYGQKRYVYFGADNPNIIRSECNASQIAENVHGSLYLVQVYAKILGISPNSDGLYPPFTTELIQNERKWRTYYHNLDPRIPVNEIHNFLGWAYITIRSHASKHGYHPDIDGLYEKELLDDLRTESMSVPYDEGWFTIRALAEVCNVDRQWVTNRLDESPYKSEQRRIYGGGDVRLHYPPDVVPYLFKLISEVPVAEADYCTVHNIMEKIGCSIGWVSRRVGRYANQSKMLLDSNSVPRVHYPIGVVKKLEAEFSKIKPIKSSSGLVSSEWVAEKFEINKSSAMRALDKIGVKKCRTKKTGESHPYWHYDGDEVMSIVWDIAEADKYMYTMTDLENLLGSSSRTISERMAILGIKSSYQEKIGGNRVFYDETAFKALKRALEVPPRALIKQQ